MVKLVFDLLVSENLLQIEKDTTLFLNSDKDIVKLQLDGPVEMLLAHVPELASEAAKSLQLGKPHLPKDLGILIKEHVVDAEAILLKLKGPPDVSVPALDFSHFFPPDLSQPCRKAGCYQAPSAYSIICA